MSIQEKFIKKGGTTANLVWFASALFYFYEYIVRITPGAMLPQLETTFGIAKDQLSVSLSSYYFIYAPLQIIVGMLFDRFGGKRLLVPAILVVTAGCFVPLLNPHSMSFMTMGRFLMGLGSAFGFVGVIYLATVWHPEHKIAFLSGMTTSLGVLAGIIGLPILTYLGVVMGWEKTFLYSGYTGLLLTGFIIFSIPKTPSWEKDRREQYKSEFRGMNFLKVVKIVLTNPQTWIIGLIGSALYLPVVVFGELWGIEYTKNTMGAKPKIASLAVSVFYLGWLVGSPITGWLSDHLKTRKRLLLWSCIIATILYSGLFLFEGINFNAFLVILFIASIITSSEVTCFVASYEANPHYIKATAIAATNMIIMLMGGIFQPIVGFILKHKAKVVETATGISYINTSGDYRTAMIIIPFMLILAIILCLFMKETYPRSIS